MSYPYAEQPQEDRRDYPESKPSVPPHSHVLMLADGSRSYWAADDVNPHAPVPSEVDGVPVVSSVHAYERSENE